jgi:SSS family solute:Na+ symporter
VRPQVTGWKSVAAQAAEIAPTRDLASNLGSWVLGCAMVYATLFGTGKLLFRIYRSAALLLTVAVVCAFLLYRKLSSTEYAQSAAASQR